MEMGPGNLHFWISDSSPEESLSLLFWILEASLLTLRLSVISIYPFPLRNSGQQHLQQRIAASTLWSPQAVFQDWHCFCETIRWCALTGCQGGGWLWPRKSWLWGLVQHPGGTRQTLLWASHDSDIFLSGATSRIRRQFLEKALNCLFHWLHLCRWRARSQELLDRWEFWFWCSINYLSHKWPGPEV